MFTVGVSPAKKPYWFALAVLLLMLLGVGFRTVTLPHEALWEDELFSRNVALHPLPEAYVIARNDMTHPPLFYLLLKVGTSLWGASPQGLRVVSLLCGIAGIGVIAMLGRRLPGAQWCGLLAAAGLAVSYYQVYYSQEVRSFELYSTLAILLALWVDLIAKRQHDMRLWLAGVVLMTLLVYTHYMGSLFVMMAVLALVVCKVETRTKLLAVASGAAAALLFMPWIVAVLSTYKSDRFKGELIWYGHPTFYDLKFLWATSVGVMNLPGATTVALLLVLLLGGAALVLVSRTQTLRQSPVVVALALMAVLPPLVVFLLSNPPFNLTLYGLRHFLPSTALLLLLCCYGLERLSQRAGRFAPLVAVGGAVVLLIVGAAPTIQALRGGRMRFPYDVLAQRVQLVEQGGASVYSIGGVVQEPLNFYCNSNCVEQLPEDLSALPPHLQLLYRPQAPFEENRYHQLLQKGYVDVSHTFYTNGAESSWGTMAANLERRY